MTLENRPVWVFAHIPKTAGTTFVREIAPKWFPHGRHVFPSRGFDLAEQVRRRDKFLDSNVRAKATFIGGHDVYGLGDTIGRPLQHFTFFRHPIDRLVSLWFHHKIGEQRPEGYRPGWAWIFDNFAGCEAYVAAANPMAEIYHTFLSAEEIALFDQRLRWRLGEQHPMVIAHPMFRTLAALALPEHGADIYEEIESLALARIARTVPLIVERFDDGILLLSRLIGVEMVSHAPQRVGDASVAERQRVFGQIVALRSLHPAADAFYQAQVHRFETLRGLHVG